jgi:hypothetical protein
MSKGPVLARVQALPYAPRSGGDPLLPRGLMARDISQWAKPDVRPLKPRSLCIYCGEDTSPATTLSGDVPSQHLMRPVQSTGRRRQGHPAYGVPVQSFNKQCTRAVRRAVLIIPSTRNFPCTLRRGRSRMSGHKKIAPAANICSFKCYIHYVPGPTCRGSVPLCMPPFGYKRRGMRRYKGSNLRLTQTLTSSYKLSNNASHSGVGCYAPVARTTLNPCVLLCFLTVSN